MQKFWYIFYTGIHTVINLAEKYLISSVSVVAPINCSLPD